MVCKKCGHNAKDDEFCPNCGAPTEPLTEPPQPDVRAIMPVAGGKAAFRLNASFANAVLIGLVVFAFLVALATIIGLLMPRRQPPEPSLAASAAAPPRAGSSSTAPVIASSAPAGVGGTRETGGIRFTLDSVEEYIDTSEYVADVPADGKTFIVLWFTVANTTTADTRVSSLYEDSYCDDYAINPKTLLMNMDGIAFSTKLAVGKKARIYLAYEVDKSWNSLEFQYTPSLSNTPNKIIFAVTPTDLAKK